MQKSTTEAAVLVLRDMAERLEKGELRLRHSAAYFPDNQNPGLVIVGLPIVRIEFEAYILSPEGVAPKSDC